MTDTPAITVQDWAQTRAALQAARSQGCAVFLCSPEAASSWLGAGYWAAMQQRARQEFPDVDFTLALDCGDSAGDVMAALRSSVSLIIFHGATATLERLQEMARQLQAEVRPR